MLFFTDRACQDPEKCRLKDPGFGADTKMRLFSRAPPLSLIAQALLRAQEATSSTFERNLARFGLMHGLVHPH